MEKVLLATEVKYLHSLMYFTSHNLSLKHWARPRCWAISTIWFRPHLYACAEVHPKKLELTRVSKCYLSCHVEIQHSTTFSNMFLKVHIMWSIYTSTQYIGVTTGKIQHLPLSQLVPTAAFEFCISKLFTPIQWLVYHDNLDYCSEGQKVCVVFSWKRSVPELECFYYCGYAHFYSVTYVRAHNDRCACAVDVVYSAILWEDV